MCCDPDPVRKRMALEGVVDEKSLKLFAGERAKSHDLVGFLTFGETGAVIEVEGDVQAVESFIHDLSLFEPVVDLMQSVSAEEIPLYGGGGFSINTK